MNKVPSSSAGIEETMHGDGQCISAGPRSIRKDDHRPGIGECVPVYISIVQIIQRNDPSSQPMVIQG